MHCLPAHGCKIDCGTQQQNTPLCKTALSGQEHQLCVVRLRPSLLRWVLPVALLFCISFDCFDCCRSTLSLSASCATWWQCSWRTRAATSQDWQSSGACAAMGRAVSSR
jgi:hypothetical protein